MGRVWICDGYVRGVWGVGEEGGEAVGVLREVVGSGTGCEEGRYGEWV